MIQSYNDTLVTEVYKQGQGLKSTEIKGFSFVSQKIGLVGLKLLIEAKLNDGSFVPAGSVAYIPEDHLSTLPFGKDVRTAKALGDTEFIMVPLRNVVFIEAPGL